MLFRQTGIRFAPAELQTATGPVRASSAALAVAAAITAASLQRVAVDGALSDRIQALRVVRRLLTLVRDNRLPGLVLANREVAEDAEGNKDTSQHPGCAFQEVWSAAGSEDVTGSPAGSDAGESAPLPTLEQNDRGHDDPDKCNENHERCKHPRVPAFGGKASYKVHPADDANKDSVGGDREEYRR